VVAASCHAAWRRSAERLARLAATHARRTRLPEAAANRMNGPLRRLSRRRVDDEQEHIAVAQDSRAHESAAGPGHPRPNNRRRPAVAECEMSDSRFRIIKGLEDRACLWIDQRDSGAPA